LSDSFWDSGLIQCLTTAGSSATALHVFLAAQVWPDRQRLNHVTKEFEAESVSFMVCQRQSIQTTSPEYLSQFVKDHADIPTISMESVMKAAGLIESMSC